MKLFGKNKVEIHQIMHHIFGLKIKKNKVLDKNEFETFLKKYHYILNEKFTSNNIENPKSDYIWQLWLQGFDNAPEIVKKCTESVKYFCHNKKIIYLDKNNISQYLEIPDYIQNKYKKGIISSAHYSDYIRLELLSKYGGFWLDATILLTDKIPEEITNSNLFLFKDLGWFNTYDRCKSLPLLLLRFLRPDLSKPDISNWFIYSKPNNPLIQCTLKFLKDYWKKEKVLKNYFMFHYWVRYAVTNNKHLSDIFEQVDNIPNLFPHLIQATWNEDFHVPLFKEICSLTPIHKLTYKNLDLCNKNYIDFILNLNFQEYENSFIKSKWGI